MKRLMYNAWLKVRYWNQPSKYQWNRLVKVDPKDAIPVIACDHCGHPQMCHDAHLIEAPEVTGLCSVARCSCLEYRAAAGETEDGCQSEGCGLTYVHYHRDTLDGIEVVRVGETEDR